MQAEYKSLLRETKIVFLSTYSDAIEQDNAININDKTLNKLQSAQKLLYIFLMQ